MPNERVCPACGAPVTADTAFCGECETLVSSAADQRPAAGAPTLPPPEPPTPRPVESRPVAPAVVVSCWSCDASNPPSRMFCAECGSFIAIGSKVFSGGSAATTSVAAAMAGPATAIAGAGTSGTGMGGTMPLGSYKVAMAEYQRSSRRRWLLAAVSVVLVAIVGLSAIYAALDRNGDGGAPGPAPAVLVSPTTVPVDEAPVVEGSADELEVQPIEEVAAEPQLIEPEAAEPEPALADEPQLIEPEAAEREPALADEPALTVEEAAMVEPETATQPESATEPDLDAAEVADPVEAVAPAVVVEEPEVAELAVEVPAPLDEPTVDEPEVDEPAKPVTPIRENPPVWRNGWVCDGELSLKDERLRDWAITRVSFLPGDGFERVALQLERVGAGSGGAAVMSAEAFPTARVKQEVPNVRQPSSGRTTLALQFRGGVRSQIGLRGYQPSGLSSVKEFNAYPVGQTASRVLVSSSTNGCFRVRVPAFTASPSALRGQVLIDIKS